MITSALCAFASAEATEFTVTNVNSDGPGSLTQAILAANAAPGADRIVFDIPGAGVHVISVGQTPLPTLTDPVTIDGYTQAGASPNTLAVGDNASILIQIDNAANDVRYGLIVEGGNSIVRGLSLTGFGNDDSCSVVAAITVREKDGNTIEGNYIGVAPDGTAKGSGSGIEVASRDNLVGGSSPSARNVISDNWLGVALVGGGKNAVVGNYIGTDASGGNRLGNEVGVVVPVGQDTNTLIGGTAAGAGNIISGNGHNIEIGSQCNGGSVGVSGVTIQSNRIGLAAGSDSRVGNSSVGIQILGSNNLIGGLDPSAGNTIAWNNGPGVSVINADKISSTGNRVLSNIMYANIEPQTLPAVDIDLGADGSTTNDVGDTDTGPNNLQNFPVITRVDSANGDTTVRGELDSAPSSTFLVQIYTDSFRPHLAGTISVTTDAYGYGRFDFSFAEQPTYGEFYIATATDAAGNTSEFSRPNGPVQLANISTRGFVGTGDTSLIAGFIVQARFAPGSRKKIAVRGLGPSVSVTPRLADPYIELYDANATLLAKNDDWKAGQEQEVSSYGLGPSSDVESALITSVAPGNYTAHVRGADGGSGNGIVELYDLDPFPASTVRVVNLSTRGFVGTGDNVLIGGIIARGDAAEKVVVRAIGPDLVQSGVSGALQDPVLELRDASGTLLAQNDDWRDWSGDAIPSGLQPHDDRDAAISTIVVPAPYTAIVRGNNSGTGVALVEFYDLTNAQ